MWLRWCAGALLLSVGGVACSPGAGPDDGTLRVVAALFPLQEAAVRVGGTEVQVTNLTPPGAEPHDVELTADAVDAFEDADVVVYLGGGFQPAVEELVDAAGDDVVTVDLRDAVEARGEDPHFWLDPRQMMVAVTAIEGALAEAAPSQSRSFASNANDFRTELEALDAAFAEGLARCARRDVVTTHTAFGYLTARYQLEQVGVSGLEPESEPPPSRIDEVARLIDERGVTTVFAEALLPRDIADTLARETGARVATLQSLEALTDEERQRGDGYTDVMRANLAALRDGLSCS
jgi:zinc transport system substrate-binding protein